MSKYALVIAVSDYLPPEQSGFEPLPNALDDARAVERVLKNIAGFDEIRRVENPDPVRLGEEIEWLFGKHRQPDDVLLLYFSGHGHKDSEQTGRFYLTTPLARQAAYGGYIKSTLLDSRIIHDALENCRSRRKVVVLDCCFSAAFGEGLTVNKDSATVDIQAALGGEGTVILASSASTRVSLARQAGELSVYTQYLVEGMETGAAGDAQGRLTADSVHQYTRRKVLETAPGMKPDIFARKQGYSIVLGQAPIGDPKLKYREELRFFIENGEIAPSGRVFLDELRAELGLSQAEAREAEEQELVPQRKYRENLRKFAQAVEGELKAASPLGEKAQERLKRVQSKLGLSDEDAARFFPSPSGRGAGGEGKPAKTRPAADGGARRADKTEPKTEDSGARLTHPTNLQTFSFETVTVDRQGQLVKKTPGQARYFSEDLGNGVTLEMVQVPAGKFLMGAAKNEQGAGGDEYPQHEVEIKQAFFMGRYPVTQAQWEAVMGANPSNFKGANRPVEQVSWRDAMEFCNKLSERTGHDYRLPSEAEWEYACRAGTNTPFYFGETLTPELANYNGNYTYAGVPKLKEPGFLARLFGNADSPVPVYRQQTTEVGQFPPNAFGLHDMHGNVWEWCQDVWHDNYNGAPADGSAWTSEGNDSRRLLRGGSWGYDPGDCRAANRGRDSPDYRVSGIGLRVVCGFSSARTL